MITTKLQWLLGKDTIAVTIFPFVIIRQEYLNDTQTITHESIHILQQKELLVIPFFIWYAAEFLIHYMKYRDFLKAYNSISFEKEAYANQDNSNYLKTRKPYSFLKYL